MYPSPNLSSPQPQQSGQPYPQPHPYAMQGPYPPPPGSMPSAQPGPYAQQSPYPAPYPYGGAPVKVHNGRAQTALIDGILSIILGLITLFTLVGYAGVITGTAAIVYGFMGLNLSKQLPNNAGRAQAITGIILGMLGWLFVLLSFALRSAMHL